MSILPDILDHNLKVVFCGSAAGAASARKGTYYAGPGNRFWDMLHHSGLTPVLLRPVDFHQLPKYGIGLTDLAKNVSGSDARIAHADYDVRGLREKIALYTPGIIAFNGKRSAAAALGVATADVDYGLQPDTIASVTVWALPSTSGSARRYWDVAHWMELVKRLRTNTG